MSNIITAGNATNNGTSISSDTSGVLELKTGSTPTTALSIDASQNVTLANGLTTSQNITTGNGAAFVFGAATTAYMQGSSTSNFLSYSTASTERMRIDSSGNLLVGTTTRGGVNSDSFDFDVQNATIYQNHINTRGNGSTYSVFGYNGGTIGSVTQNGTTAVAYNTSSDYRLKNTIAPMTDALAKVAALKPVTYKWNADGSDGQGFIAHELAEVVPECVTGEKDAVDADGKPVYQGIDTSFLVATLTAAIQELKAELDATKAEVAALKGA